MGMSSVESETNERSCEAIAQQVHPCSVAKGKGGRADFETKWKNRSAPCDSNSPASAASAVNWGRSQGVNEGNEVERMNGVGGMKDKGRDSKGANLWANAASLKDGAHG